MLSAAFVAAAERFGIRVVALGVQGNHLHLLVASRMDERRGYRRAARPVNAKHSAQRRGHRSVSSAPPGSAP